MERSLSDKQAQWLRGELKEWRSRGIVTDEQSERILGCYESIETASARKRSRFTFAIIAIAALLFGAAVLLLVGHNWDAIPRVAKLAMVFGVVAATHGAGLYLRFVRGAQRPSELVFFLGCLLYGVGIWLVAQVFHLDAHWPDGFWWWALGVLPFALCLDTVLIHVLYAALLAGWAGCEVLGYRHIGMVLFYGWSIPNGAYSFLLMCLPGIIWAYRKNSIGALRVYVPAMAWWVILQAFAWHLDFQSVFLIGSVGALLLIVAANHRKGSALAGPYQFYGIALTAFALVPLSFNGFYPEFHSFYRRGADRTEEFALLIAILVLLGVVVALSALFRPQKEMTQASERLMALLRAQWLPVGLVLAMTFMAFYSSSRDFSENWRYSNSRPFMLSTVVANVAMIVFAIWLMASGLQQDRGRRFAFGVFYLVLWTICRYCDLFGASGGMLGAALMFFLCGAMLFALGLYWRNRPERHAAVVDAGDSVELKHRIAFAWFAGHERQALAATAAAQLAVMGGMIVLNALPLLTGDSIRLKVEPVDPRNLMRGDYVILSYDISRVPDRGVEGIPNSNKSSWWRGWSSDEWLQERTVYVTLEKQQNQFWAGTKVSVNKPESGKFIKGKYVRQWGMPRIQFGIEAFYVQEGRGKVLEAARNARRLEADVALMSNGKAALRNVHVSSSPE